MSEEPLRVMIVDDHPMFREGLAAILSSDAGIELVGAAPDGLSAVAMAADLLPDVVLMDLNLPDLNGIDATRRILETTPHIAVLVITMFEDDHSVFAAMRAGARGYLLKGATRPEILRAIRAAGSGEAIFGATVAQQLINYFRNPVAERGRVAFPELTGREREILDLIAAGHNNNEITRRLVLSPKTVRNHISNIFAKLQVADRAQAIVRAREAGLGQSPPQ